MISRLLSVTLLVAAALTLGACASDSSKVSSKDLATVRSEYNALSVGMSRDEVAAALSKGSFTRLASSSMAGASIEEWKIEAYHDDDWNKSRELFVGFLYFADGALVDMSGSRINYRDRPEIVQSWGGGN